jgi:3',5'-cyclic AMP phosphodiesterase CpdA
MPIYFSELPPTCPISRDQPVGPMSPYLFGRPKFIRPAIPPARDLQSAISTANIARSIVTSLTINKVINNVHTPPNNGFLAVTKDKYKTKKARGVEQRDKRVKRQYKYYGKNEDGSQNKDIWVIMERIERMVWYDRAWKSYLTWEYGDKGEGVPVRSGDGA